MPAKEDISKEIGKKYNLLTILKDLGTRKYGGSKKCTATFVLAECECGKQFEVRLHSIRSNQTISCGCLLRSSYHKYGIKIKNHHKSRTKDHNRWWGMITRCYNKNRDTYKEYGGRGIIVCEEWKQSFDKFIEDMGYPPTEKHTLERIDNNGNYCKENCTWSTMKEQARNRRNSIKIEYNGDCLSLPEWCEKLNLNYKLIGARLLKGWSFERAISTPKRNANHGEQASLPQKL
jgi:hypothetical protein